jgi:hypothetical protein
VVTEAAPAVTAEVHQEATRAEGVAATQRVQTRARERTVVSVVMQRAAELVVNQAG